MSASTGASLLDILGMLLVFLHGCEGVGWKVGPEVTIDGGNNELYSIIGWL